MAAASVPQSQMKEIVTCTLCFEVFNSAEKLPKGLPCMHTFCLECLEKYVKNQLDLVLPCPLCQGNFTVPKDGVGAIPTNILVKQIVETLPMKDIKTIPSKGRCKEHQREAGEFVCITCSVPMCDECIINLGKGSHSNHILDKMQTTVDRMRHETKVLSEKAASIHDRGYKKYQTMRSELVSSKAESITAAKKRASKAHADVDQWLSTTETEIGSAFEQMDRNVQKNQNTLKSEIDHMNESLKKVDAHLDSDDVKNSSKLLAEMKQTLEVLETSITGHPERDSITTGHLSDQYIVDLGQYTYSLLMTDTIGKCLV